MLPVLFMFSGLSEKRVADAFWNGELEAELRERGQLDMYGMCHSDSDGEAIMTHINQLRARSNYFHPQMIAQPTVRPEVTAFIPCSTYFHIIVITNERRVTHVVNFLLTCHLYIILHNLGCGKLWVADGQWKLMFAHCMMNRKVRIFVLFTFNLLEISQQWLEFE